MALLCEKCKKEADATAIATTSKIKTPYKDNITQKGVLSI
jgi:hypothetical protein